MGKWGVYHGEETKKGWPGKGRLLVDGLSESQAKSIEQTHNAALAAAKAGGWLSQEALDEYAKVEQEAQQLRDQLAAERDKANVRETELICERDYFKKELEAARLLK